MKYTIQDLATLLNGNPDLAADIEIECSLAPAQVQLAGHESEHDLQKRIFAECRRRAVADARWQFVIAVPNGQYRAGERMEPGLAAGFPDILVLHRNRGYGAMAIELKVGRNKTTQAQNEWIGRLNEAGYYACVCRSFEEAMRIMEEYLA